jgi:hypothetical protein
VPFIHWSRVDYQSFAFRRTDNSREGTSLFSIASASSNVDDAVELKIFDQIFLSVTGFVSNEMK